MKQQIESLKSKQRLPSKVTNVLRVQNASSIISTNMNQWGREKLDLTRYCLTTTEESLNTWDKHQ